MKHIKIRLLKWAIFLFIFINLILSAWSVLHKDIYYYTDIARDFLIFDEVVAKKIVLIGPRADVQGLFHGILWHYLNMPAYLIGKGNPVIVGWFWILLTVAFLASGYIAMKNLFDQKSAIIAIVLLSSAMVPIAQGFFHGNGAMLVLPAFLYLFVRYMQTANPWYLVGHLFAVGMIVQFEIALGIPLIILSTVANLYLIIRRKKFVHLAAFGVLAFFFSTFLLADIRHNFLQLRSLVSYANGAHNESSIPFIKSLDDRFFDLSTHGLNFLRSPLHSFNRVVFLFMIYGLFYIFKKRDKRKNIYTAFLYFYLGYYALTLLHEGYLIMFWWLPMSVFPLLMFSSIHNYTSKRAYFGLLIVLLIVSGYQNILFIRKIDSGFGKTNSSWRFHLNNAKKVFADAPQQFGYFIYAPDIFGYQAKYAMSYAQKLYPKKAFNFTKKPTTYILVEPPPGFRSDLKPELWIKNDLAISSSPVKIISLDGGYQIRKYLLTQADLNAYAKITPTDWLFYR